MKIEGSPDEMCKLFGLVHREGVVLLEVASRIYATMTLIQTNPPQPPAFWADQARQRAEAFLAALREDKPADAPPPPTRPSTILLPTGVRT